MRNFMLACNYICFYPDLSCSSTWHRDTHTHTQKHLLLLILGGGWCIIYGSCLNGQLCYAASFIVFYVVWKKKKNTLGCSTTHSGRDMRHTRADDTMIKHIAFARMFGGCSACIRSYGMFCLSCACGVWMRSLCEFYVWALDMWGVWCCGVGT